MTDGNISRREVLIGAGAGLGALSFGIGSAGAEGGEYNVGTASPAAERAARNAADRVERVLEWGDGEKTITGTFSEGAIDDLENRPGVRYTEVNGEMRAIAQTLPWGVDRVDAEIAHANGETGGDDTDGEGGADIAIVDTGIDSDHPDLDVNIGTGKAFVECEPLDNRGGCMFGIKPNDNPCNTKWDDDNDHGSHVSGTADADDDSSDVVGVSTEATLHAVKVLDACGSGSYSDVAAGIEWVADQGYDVANMSLGGDKSSTVEDAVEYAYGKGVLLVAAAGNDGPCSDCVSYPAAEPEVIAVSATTKDDTLADFSSTGPEVELAAPGKDILSTVPPESDSDGLASFDGTSMASPHVAGAGGQLMDNGYTNTEARDQLNSTAEDINLSSNEQGNGLVDVAASLGLDSSDDLNENSSPSVSWNNPSDGATVSGDVDIDISAGDSDGSISKVEWKYEGGSYTEISDTDGDGTYDDTWDSTAVSDGTYTLYARATDDDGAQSTATISVTVDNTDNAPSVSWVNPSDGETVSGTITIQIDASDDRDSGSDLTVEWQVDDGTWRTASYNSDSGYYEDSWDTTTVSDGDHGLDARATDTSGNTSSEARITVTVDNTSGAPTVDSLSLSEDNSGGSPHAEFDASWSVSDPDGDLDTVDLTLTDADTGATEDSASVDVSGSDASGTTDLKAKFDENNGHTYEVELVVTDTGGNTASDTATEVEDGS